MFALDHKRELSGCWDWMLAGGSIDPVLTLFIFAGLPGKAAWRSASCSASIWHSAVQHRSPWRCVRGMSQPGGFAARPARGGILPTFADT